jgi:pimeloyl-ACP methyl ester carboxylesterase
VITTTPSSRHVTVNGLTCRYLEWGEADAPAVVLLHGLRSYARTWEPAARVLAETHRVIAPDLRGRGESGWDPERDYYVNTYVRDLEALAGLLDLTRFALVGHSLGGAVSYTFAARHPDQVTALVVEDIGPGSSTGTEGAQRILREMRETPSGFDSLEAVRAYWRRLRPDIDEAALTSRIENTVKRTDAGRYEWSLDMAGIAAARLSGDPAGPIDLWTCVEALRCPILVIRGARSDFLARETCEQMARRQPALRWAQVPGAGHYVHDDNPAEFTRLVTEFLAGGAP